MAPFMLLKMLTVWLRDCMEVEKCPSGCTVAVHNSANGRLHFSGANTMKRNCSHNMPPCEDLTNLWRAVFSYQIRKNRDPVGAKLISKYVLCIQVKTKKNSLGEKGTLLNSNPKFCKAEKRI